jgi:hypothetical protein
MYIWDKVSWTVVLYLPCVHLANADKQSYSSYAHLYGIHCTQIASYLVYPTTTIKYTRRGIYEPTFCTVQGIAEMTVIYRDGEYRTRVFRIQSGNWRHTYMQCTICFLFSFGWCKKEFPNRDSNPGRVGESHVS